MSHPAPRAAAGTTAYDVAGIRWDADRGDNLVIFEKRLTE